MGADFKPVLDGYANLRPFMFWAQTTLPTVFDDSLSYYEVLTKLCKMVNVLLENTDTAEHNIEAIAETYEKLQDYVNHYFDNLNVQEEVEIALDKMAADGDFDAMIAPIVHADVAEKLPEIVEEQIDGVVADQIDDAVARYADPVIETYVEAEVAGAVTEELPDVVAEVLPAVVENQLSDVVDSQLPGAVEDYLTHSDIVEDYLDLKLPYLVEADLDDVVADQIGDVVADELPNVVTPYVNIQVPQITTGWLTDHITNPSSPPIDTSLTVAGAAADAWATGRRIHDVLSTNYTYEEDTKLDYETGVISAETDWITFTARVRAGCTVKVYYPKFDHSASPLVEWTYGFYTANDAFVPNSGGEWEDQINWVSKTVDVPLVASFIKFSVQESVPFLADDLIVEVCENAGEIIGTIIGSVPVVVDPTLSIEGDAADAKVTGDKFFDINSELLNITGDTGYVAEGYKKVTAIETPGYTYVNTNIGWNNSARYPTVEVDCISTGGKIFGSARTAKRQCSGGPDIGWWYDGKKVEPTETIAYLNKRHTFKVTPTAFYVDNVQVGNSYTVSSGAASSNTFAVFGCHAYPGESTVSDSYATAGSRVFGFKIYDYVDDALHMLFEGVPCIRESDGKAGFYNTVNSTFYTSVNENELVAIEYESLDDVTTDLYELNLGKQNNLTFDDAPAPNSVNPVTSSGICNYVDTPAKNDCVVSVFSAGAISFNSGNNADSSVRIRTGVIPIDSVYEASINDDIAIYVFFYGKFGFNYLGYRTFHGRITAENIKSIKNLTFTSSAYVRFVFGENATPVTLENKDSLNANVYFSVSALDKEAYSNLLEGTFTESFTIPCFYGINKYDNVIIECISTYSGTSQPTISFAGNWTNSPYESGSAGFSSSNYLIGKGNNKYRNTWRVPPIEPYGNGYFNIRVNIPEGSSLTIYRLASIKETPVLDTNSNVKFQAHSYSGCGAPFCTLAQAELAAKLGYKYCIMVPKVTSDGYYVCLHDDANIQRTIRNANGSPLSAEDRDRPISTFTYNELLQFDAGIFLGKAFEGEKIPLLEDFFEICMKTGMHPVLSIHPALAGEWDNIKALAKKWNVLDKLNIKAPVSQLDFVPSEDPTKTSVMSVMLNDVESYAIVKSDSVSVNGAINSMNTFIQRRGITVPCGIEIKSADATDAAITNVLNAGYFVGVNGYDKDIKKVKDFINKGVTRFTEDYNASIGLNW